MTTNQTKAVLNMACDNIFDINYISQYYNNLGEKKLFKNFIKELCKEEPDLKIYAKKVKKRLDLFK